MVLEGLVEVGRKNIIGGRAAGRVGRRKVRLGSAVSFAKLWTFIDIFILFCSSLPLVSIACHSLIGHLFVHLLRILPTNATDTLHKTIRCQKKEIYIWYIFASRISW